MNDSASSSTATDVGWRVLETLLWGFALFMVIPPVLSDIEEQHSPTSALIMGGAAFCAHIGIKVWHKEETLLFGATKAVIYAILVVVVNMRVFM